ncbi:hypothetical protein BLOT_011135 [Blomia tropicalis]|nr:hypothetical protein BLOT_011135 [Blomia tropicalis]
MAFPNRKMFWCRQSSFILPNDSQTLCRWQMFAIATSVALSVYPFVKFMCPHLPLLNFDFLLFRILYRTQHYIVRNNNRCFDQFDLSTIISQNVVYHFKINEFEMQFVSIHSMKTISV